MDTGIQVVPAFEIRRGDVMVFGSKAPYREFDVSSAELSPGTELVKISLRSRVSGRWIEKNPTATELFSIRPRAEA